MFAPLLLTAYSTRRLMGSPLGKTNLVMNEVRVVVDSE
jgi:hypothetical protein